jgi:tetratricopeptide (TPR) repeat protein
MFQSHQERSQHNNDNTGIHRQEQTFSEKIWLPSGLRRTKEHQQETTEKIDSLQLLRDWLGDNTRWLLILDNVDDPVLLQDILPERHNGHILLTTQLRGLEVPAKEIAVKQVTPYEGAQMLFKCAKLTQTEQEQKENQYFAQKLSELVGGLPLALDQAGAYIDENHISVEDYVTLFKAKSAELLKKRGKHLTGKHGEDIYGIHLESVITTFKISSEKIEGINPIAAHILYICAFLDTDDIPEEILKEAIHVLSGSNKMIETENVQALAVLRNYSLLQHNPGNGLYTIHRLLPIALKDAEIIPANQQQNWAEKTITIVNHTPIALKKDTQTTPTNGQQRSQTQLYLAHARVCFTHIKKWDIQSADAVELLNRVGAFLYEQREYAQAQQSYEQLLHIKKRRQGASNLDRARTLSILANLVYQQKDKAKYEQAEQWYKEALTIFKSELAPSNPNNPHIGQVMSYYALLLQHLKEHRKKAEGLAIAANKIHVGMTYEAQKRWFGRWAGFHNVEEHETFPGYGAFYLAVIGIPVTFGLLLQSWLWGCGSFITILVGMIVLILGNKYGFSDKSILLRIVWIFFFLSLSSIIGSGAWIAGKSLLILWQLAYWPTPLQYVLQGVCVLVTVIAFVVALAITDSFVSFPKYTLVIPTFTSTVSLYVLPILSGVLLHSWAIFGLMLFVTWSLYFYISIYMSRKAFPGYRTLVACIFSCIWGYMGWILAGFLNLHISGYIWQQILHYTLAFACSLIGFICHNITFANSNFIGYENSVLVLEDLWIDFDAAAMLGAMVSEPIKDWTIFYSTLARGYLNRGKNEEAIANLSKAITYAPNSANYRASCHSLRGSIYLCQGDHTNAISDFTEAISIDSKNAFDYRSRGQVYLSQGDYAHALEDFYKVLELDPKDAVAYLNRGQIYIAQGNYTDAIADFTTVIAIDPKHSYAYHCRGNAYNTQHDYSLAIADFNKAIELNPDDAPSYNARSSIYYFEQHDSASALVDLDQAIFLDPTYADAYFGRGNIYYDQHNYSRAIADYNQAILLDPKFTLAYNDRGKAYSAQHDYSQAIVDYNQAILLDPNNAVFRTNRGNAYFAQKDYTSAMADYDQAILLDPECSFAYNGRGNVYYKQNDSAQAIINYTQAIEITPTNTVFHCNRGYAYLAQDDYVRALVDFNQAIELDPRYIPAYTGRGNAYSLQGDSAKANVDYTFASKLKHATGEPNTASVPNEPPAQDISQQYTDNTSESVPSATEETQNTTAMAESPFVQSGHSLDGDAVLESLKRGNIPPSWQVYSDPNIMTKIKYAGYFFSICTVLFASIILVVANLLHLSWLLWILPVTIGIEALFFALGGIQYKHTKLVILPDGFVYRYIKKPIISYSYQALSEMTVKELDVTLILKCGEEPKYTFDVSEAALQSLKNTYLAFKNQSKPHTTESVFVQSGFSIDGKKVLARVKQGKTLPEWQIYKDPNVTTTFIHLGVLYIVCIELLLSSILVVESLLHLSWHSWPFWGLLSILVLAGLLIMATYVESKKTKLVILPEGFVYASTSEEADFSFHFDTLQNLIIQKKTVTVVLVNDKQQTTSFSVSEVALQNLQMAYRAFKTQDRSTFFIDEENILAQVKQRNVPPSWQIHTDPNAFISIMILGSLYALVAGLFISIVLIVESLLHLSWHSWLFWIMLSVLLLVGFLAVEIGVWLKNTKLIILPEGFVYSNFGEPRIGLQYTALNDLTIDGLKVTLVFNGGERQTMSLSVSEVALQNLRDTYIAFKAQTVQ